MNTHIDLSDLEGEDSDTATALLAAFEGVALDRPSLARCTAEDEQTAELLAQAFDGIRLNRPAPVRTTTPGAPAIPPARVVALTTRSAGRRRSRVWLAGAVAAVLALTLTVAVSPGGSSVAWAAEPAAPTQADRDAAAIACGAPLARGLGALESSGSASLPGADPSVAPESAPGVPESLPPLAVLDIRGDGALAIYQDPTWQVTCLLTRETGSWVDQGILVGPGPATGTPGLLFGSRTSWVGGDSVSYLGGSVPAGTTNVTFDLNDGSTVRASVLGTTFAAWYPGERNYVPGSLMTYDANGSPQP